MQAALHQLGAQLIDEAARKDFGVFQRAVHPLVSGEPYVHALHSQAITHALTGVARGESNRLIIAVPPRHFKSYLASVALPAFLLGQDPKLHIVCASYGADLALGLAKQFRQVVLSPDYGRMFPKARLSSANPPLHHIRTTHNGYRLATSVGGVITGLGADIAILDDPMKASDASSQPARDGVAEWFKTSLVTRFDKPAAARIVVVMQRLHQDDLAGRLMAEGGWEVLELPAQTQTEYSLQLGYNNARIVKPGGLLFPERFPEAELDRLRASMGEAAYSAQMLQRPTPAGGHLFNLAKVKRFELGPTVQFSKFDAVVGSIDCAAAVTSSADYTAFTLWGIRGRDLYLLFARRGRWTIDQTKKQLSDFLPQLDHPKRGILIENGGSGLGLYQALREEWCNRCWTWNAKNGKEARADVANLRIEQGLIYLPAAKPWLGEFENELAEFPHGKNDDYVDSFTQVVWNLEGYLPAKLQLKAYPTPKAS